MRWRAGKEASVEVKIQNQGIIDIWGQYCGQIISYFIQKGRKSVTIEIILQLNLSFPKWTLVPLVRSSFWTDWIFFRTASSSIHPPINDTFEHWRKRKDIEPLPYTDMQHSISLVRKEIIITEEQIKFYAGRRSISCNLSSERFDKAVSQVLKFSMSELNQKLWRFKDGFFASIIFNG